MAETAQTQVRITDALTYVERQLAMARDYQSAAIVKAASDYVAQLEKQIAELSEDKTVLAAANDDLTRNGSAA